MLWGRECGVDFGVSSKFQGVDSNLLKLKSVKLPSSSFQNCHSCSLNLFDYRSYVLVAATNVAQVQKGSVSWDNPH